MHALTRFLLAAFVTSLGLAPPVLADSPTRGEVYVAGDHVDPGAPFTLIGFRLDEGAVLHVSLVSGSTVADVGSARVGPDGSMSTELSVPGGFPVGYAELRATDAGGSTWTTIMLVGPRSEGQGQPLGPIAEQAPEWNPPAVLALAVGVAFAAYALYRYARGRIGPRSA